MPTGRVTVGKSFNLLEHQFSHLYSSDQQMFVVSTPHTYGVSLAPGTSPGLEGQRLRQRPLEVTTLVT